ncbi:uncharacterized protein ELE39_000437 [Cryptosporidium sp. chipmunk genotype I]|uniref:uncharacterized protein n=1 Tax=Cryptosporidium sp. chipmunk genotype I TaxID=1280935 RepID=UPI00351A7689|nr:hypothetical protein ELE39_000437 [Cryptosporidium sp. chipmunk genotype I]
MQKNNAPNYDKIIMSELEHQNWKCLDLKEFSDQFSEKPVFELDYEEINVKIREILKNKNIVRPIILLIIANRLIKIANKTIIFKAGKNLEENVFLPELEFLSFLLKEGNIISDCCEYFKLLGFKEKGINNSFTIEALNAMIKVPALAINSVLALKPSLKNIMDIRILDKYIPRELHDSIYYEYICICTLYILNDIKPADKATFKVLQVIFSRLFLRGYKEILCKIMVRWSVTTDDSVFENNRLLNNGELCLSRVFDNILQVNKTDENLIRSFIKQLFKEIEATRVQVNQGVPFLKLKDRNVGEELNVEDIKSDGFFLLVKSMVEFCVIEEDLKENKGFLKSDMFQVKKQNFSIKTYLIFLDICVLNIAKNDEFRKYLLPEQHFDYLEIIRSKKLAILEESNKSKIYLNFLKELTQCLTKQWNSYQDSMAYSLTLSTVIVRSVSILIYLNLGNLSNFKGVLFEFYLDITEGIQFRLKNIDPLIRSSAMYLGEFYFNLLYELFPSVNEADSGYLMSEIPKFDELKLLTPEIKNRLSCIYSSTKFFIIKAFSHECEVQVTNTIESTNDMDLNMGEKELTENQGNIVDEDDEFWNKVPSIEVNHKNGEKIQPKVSKGLLSTTDMEYKKKESKRKLVNKSFDLINLYTDEKKSKEIPDKAEKLLNVLKELAEDIENDDSNYDHLVLPLVDKLISLKEKDQRILALLIFSKLIQCRTDKVAVNMINYSCNMNNGIPMDVRILVLNSLTSACQNMANTKSNTKSTMRSNKKTIINLFDKYSLIWSSHLVKYIMELISQSEDHEGFEKIPNIFFISSLELFNQIIVNTSSNNVNIEQIAYSGLEFITSIDLMNNHLFKDVTIRKSIYMLTFNIILKHKYSSYFLALNQILPRVTTWLSKAEISETDLNSIQIIQETKSFIS